MSAFTNNGRVVLDLQLPYQQATYADVLNQHVKGYVSLPRELVLTMANRAASQGDRVVEMAALLIAAELTPNGCGCDLDVYCDEHTRAYRVAAGN